MDNLIAATKFLLETVNNGSTVITLTYNAVNPTDAIDLGHLTVGVGLVAGYYILHVTSPNGITEDDFVGSWHFHGPIGFHRPSAEGEQDRGGHDALSPPRAAGARSC